jgi:hypothetical protein
MQHGGVLGDLRLLLLAIARPGQPDAEPTAIDRA